MKKKLYKIKIQYEKIIEATDENEALDKFYETIYSNNETPETMFSDLIKITETTIKAEQQREFNEITDDLHTIDTNETKCHLCGSKETHGGWCTNETCQEYKNPK